MTRPRPAAAALLAGLLLLSACGRTAAAPGAPRPLTVFAAASLTDVLRDLGALYERQPPGSRVTFSFAGSQSLVAQVQQGAPADVVVTADTTSADAVAGQLAGPARVLARNRLAIVTAPGDPERLRTLRDLARPGVRVVPDAPT
ncbi:MAG: substrate-binding domain-containing protein, partial [Actinomycetota bacterium]|nr:substrate-binding domain-containing protein [Actinomycetota bacterium]